MLPALLIAVAAHGSLHFVEDDYGKARAAARAQHKPLFVDFWATWCHTCLSMQRFVLSDPGMKPVADAVVWSSIETERERNKPVVDKYPLDSWPTFLIIDPESEAVLGRFLGAGTVQDLRGFVHDAVAAYAAKGKPPDAATAAQREGDAARNRGDLKATADAYARSVRLSKLGDPRRPERLNLEMSALRHAKDFRACVQEGLREARNTPDSALGADFQSMAFACAGELSKDDAEARKMMELAAARTREIVSRKDAPLATDDRSDALANLSEMLDVAGKHSEAVAVMRERAQLLEKAAAAAPDVTMAATFDAHRTDTYLYLKTPQKAEQLLAEREKQMADDYNPPARLARVYLEEKKLEDAEGAVDRALSKMDRGQRRIGILGLKATILKAEGKPVAAVLREQLEVLRALPATQRRPEMEAKIERELGSASR